MAAVLIKQKAVTLQEKLNIVQEVEANPNATLIQMFMLFLYKLYDFFSIFPSFHDNIHLYIL
jgi:hypothetical protein